MLNIETSLKSPHSKALSGSVKELWSLSLPLMISLMSGSLMCFLDRLFLAHYSVEALNASVNAGSITATLQFCFISIASIAEVFVGQLNGAGKKEELAAPVWQMIWLSLLTFFIFPTLSFFLSPVLFGSTQESVMEATYFHWLMGFGPFFCLGAALSCFYIGQGKVIYVTFLAIFANILNIVLDYVLIFGVGSQVPEMGIAGAAIATGISQMAFCLILFCCFLSKKNHREFGTRNYHFDFPLFSQCVRIGVPNSLAHTIELFAWAVLFKMMVSMGEDYITVVSVAQTIFFLFTFITESVSKAASTIAANLIGSNQWKQLFFLFRSGLKFYLQIFVLLSAALVLYPESIVNWFLSQDYLSSHPVLKTQIFSACFWVWIFFLFDGIHWLLVGLLTAAGDTKFVLKAGGTSIWIFVILPIYLFTVQWGYGPDVVWMIIACYGMINGFIYYRRLISQKWKTAIYDVLV